MALTTVQKKQALRIPVVDASVTTADKFALLGLIPPETTASNLTSVQKKQLLRIPVVDASVSTSDKFALLGLVESAGTGPTIDTFSLAWTIDPTYSMSESVDTFTGAISVSLNEFQIQIKAVAEEIRGDPSFYEICDRTGFKMYPWWHPLSELVEDGYGNFVRAKSADPVHPQDKIRSRGNDPSEGPQFAESDNTFVSTSIAPEDL